MSARWSAIPFSRVVLAAHTMRPRRPWHCTIWQRVIFRWPDRRRPTPATASHTTVGAERDRFHAFRCEAARYGWQHGDVSWACAAPLVRAWRSPNGPAKVGFGFALAGGLRRGSGLPGTHSYGAP